jgi:hypothetical protein
VSENKVKAALTCLIVAFFWREEEWQSNAAYLLDYVRCTELGQITSHPTSPSSRSARSPCGGLGDVLILFFFWLLPEYCRSQVVVQSKLQQKALREKETRQGSSAWNNWKLSPPIDKF